MPRTSATSRIVISLVSLSTSLLLLGSLIGILPDATGEILSNRMRLCESLAISFSAMAHQADQTHLETYFGHIVERNPEIVSLGIRQSDGNLLVDIGDHHDTWTSTEANQSTQTELVVPVYAKDEQWGALEARFEPITVAGSNGIMSRTEFRLAAYMATTSLIFYSLYLRRVLRHLNPSKVIPTRVREAFDALAEGLVVLDQSEQIVLVNRAFEEASGASAEELIGRSIEALPFVSRSSDTPTEMPWQETAVSLRLVRGRLLALEYGPSADKTFSVSSAPILDEKGNKRGAVVSFEDVSELERRTEELRLTVEKLHASSEKIKQQNRDLEHLATRDPLTGCFNRRSFLERFETHWRSANRYDHPLSVIMVDVDHFKSVNDNHGHSTGDVVLQRVASTLQNKARDSDVVCRFGGEEFAIVLPHTDLDHATRAAEKFRLAVEQLVFAELAVTISVGVSAFSEGPADPQALLDQADRCLYVAKRNGRNQVVRWDDVPADVPREDADARKDETLPKDDGASIPFHAVSALISALGYRDQATAEHSRRVADLCVSVAEGLLSLRDSYTLEIAAMLHDIGKIGVPDSILLKPGPLTPDEWKVMHSQDRIGAEIIRASFQSEGLSRIVETHHLHFGAEPKNSISPAGRTIPVGARILAVADAYDSMVTDRSYRKGKSHQEAVEELQRCAGKQFDPQIVNRFVRVLQNRAQRNQTPRTSVSREAALSIGNQLERLIAVLDQQDLDQIRILSQRLCSTASKLGASEVAEKAAELESCIQSDHDSLSIMQAANELLDMCRPAQHSLPSSESH